jgi:hypothetical protein
LIPESFSLNTEQAVVLLAARYNKNRKPRVQPLPASILDLLRGYLAEKPPKQLLWKGTWASDHRGAEMLRKDLAEAGIPYVIEGPDGPLHADFHALRHTFITQLGRNGVDLRTTQLLAGHSSPVQTAKYSHSGLNDLAKAVQKLQDILPKEEVKSKGQRSEPKKVCSGLDQPGIISGHSGSGGVSEEGSKTREPESTQSLITQRLGQGMSATGRLSLKRGRRDSNPQPPDRQSADNDTKTLEIAVDSVSPRVRLHDSCTETEENTSMKPTSPLISALIAVLNKLHLSDREKIIQILTETDASRGSGISPHLIYHVRALQVPGCGI